MPTDRRDELARQRGLTSVVATFYLLGGSTPLMHKLVQFLGITTLSKSRVSQMAKELDAHGESCGRRGQPRHWRLNEGPARES